MANFSNDKQRDLAFKFASGILGSATGKAWFQENFKSISNAQADDIWLQPVSSATSVADANTVTAAQSYVDYDERILTLQSGHNGTLWLARSDSGDQTSSRIRNYISPLDALTPDGGPSLGYQVKLYEDNGSSSSPGSEITTTDGAWMFFYKEGALILDEAKIVGSSSFNKDAPLWIRAYRYTGTTVDSLSAAGAGTTANLAIESLQSATAALDAARLALSADTISSAVDSLESATATLAGASANSAIDSLESATAGMIDGTIGFTALTATTISAQSISALGNISAATAVVSQINTTQEVFTDISMSGEITDFVGTDGNTGVTINANDPATMLVAGTLSANSISATNLSANGVTFAELVSSAIANAAGTATNASSIIALSADTISSAVDSLETTTATMQGAIDSLELATGSMSASTISSAVDSLETTTATMQGAIDSLESATGSISANTISSAVDSLEATTATMQSAIDSLESATGSISASTISAAVDSLESATATLAGASANDAIDSLEAATADLNTNISTNATDIASLESATGVNAGLIDSLESATAGMIGGTIPFASLTSSTIKAGSPVATGSGRHVTTINTSGHVGIATFTNRAPLHVVGFQKNDTDLVVQVGTRNTTDGTSFTDQDKIFAITKFGDAYIQEGLTAGSISADSISSNGITVADIAASAASNAAATAHLAGLTSGFSVSGDVISLAGDISTLQDEMNGVEAGTGTNAAAISSLESATGALNNEISSLESATAAILSGAVTFQKIVTTGGITATNNFFDGKNYFDTNSGNDPLYITRNGGSDQGLVVCATDRTVQVRYVEDTSEPSAGQVQFFTQVGDGTATGYKNMVLHGGFGNAGMSGNVEFPYSISAGGAVSGTTFHGDGSALTNLPAGLTANAAIASLQTATGEMIDGTIQFTKLNVNTLTAQGKLSLINGDILSDNNVDILRLNESGSNTARMGSLAVSSNYIGGSTQLAKIPSPRSAYFGGHVFINRKLAVGSGDADDTNRFQATVTVSDEHSLKAKSITATELKIGTTSVSGFQNLLDGLFAATAVINTRSLNNQNDIASLESATAGINSIAASNAGAIITNANNIDSLESATAELMSACGSLTSEVLGLISATADIATGTATNASFIDSLETLTSQINLGTQKLAFVQTDGLSAGTLSAGMPDVAGETSGATTHINASGWVGIQTNNAINEKAPLHVNAKNNHKDHIVVFESRASNPDGGTLFTNNKWTLDNNFNQFTSGSITAGGTVSALAVCAETIHSNTFTYNSTTGTNITSTAEVVEIAGSVSITGDTLDPIAQHAFRVIPNGNSNSATKYFLITTGGQVGIGTNTVPTGVDLHATGAISAQTVCAGTLDVATFKFNNTINAPGVSAGALTAGALTNTASDSFPTMISSSGWLGIQTSNPHAPLHIDYFNPDSTVSSTVVRIDRRNVGGDLGSEADNIVAIYTNGSMALNNNLTAATLVGTSITAMGISSEGIAFADLAASAAGNAAGTGVNASAIASLESATATLGGGAGTTANLAIESLQSATAALDAARLALSAGTISSDLDTAEGAIGSLESATAALDALVSSNAGALVTAANNIDSLESATAALNTARLALSADTISAAVDSLESATATLAGASANSAIDSLESATAGLAGATANAAFDSLESATGHLASLTSGYASSADFSSIAVDVSTLQNEMNGVEAGTGTNASAIGSLESATATLAGASANSAIDSLESATAALDAARLALSAGTISSNLDTAEGAIDSLESATATLNTKDTALAAGTGTNASAIGSLESATAALNAARLALSADTISSAVNSLKSATADMADGTTLQDEVRTKSLSSLSSHVGGVHNHTLGRYPTLINLSGYVGVQTNFPESPLHINGMNLKGSDRLVTIEARYATAMTTNQFRDLVIVTTAGNIEVKGTISGNHLKGNTLSSDGISLAQLITSADANAAGTGVNASAIGSLESATGVLSISSIANAAGTGTNASAIGSLESATAALNTKDTALAAGTGTNASAIGSLESATGTLTTDLGSVSTTVVNQSNTLVGILVGTATNASLINSLESATAEINNATSTAVLYADDYSVSGSSGASTFATVSPVGDVVKMGFGTSIAGGLIYLDPITKEWKGCNMNGGGSGASALVGIALGTSPSSDGVLIRGRVTMADSFCVNFSDTDFGSIFYIAQNGKVSPDAPDGSGQYVRALGYIIDPGVNKTVYFNPSKTFIRVR